VKNFAVAALAAALLASPAQADTFVDNVNGITLDEAGKVARFTGFIMDDDGVILRVLDDTSKRPKRKEIEFHVDGEGRVVVPGMIDSHVHVLDIGFAQLTLDLSPAKSLDEALARIQAYAAAHPDRPWIIGTGWNHEAWGMGSFPTAAELDAVTGGRPTWLMRVDGHAGWANSAALAAAGIGAATQAPEGGSIGRDAAGAPSGILVDAAMGLVAPHVPKPRPIDEDSAFALAQMWLLENGVTTVADMGTTIEEWQTFRRAGDRGDLRLRIAAYAAGVQAMQLIGGPGPTPWLYGDRLRLNGVKLYMDGALGSRGAWLKAPYADAPGQRGLPLMTDTQLGNLMSRAAFDDFQVAVHAIGDKANSSTISAIAELSQTYKGDRRWRIEHAQVIDPADIARLSGLDVVASMQPQHQTSDRLMAEARLGPERLAGAYAWKSVQATGTPLAFGSDAPVEPAKPFWGLAAAITRADAEGQPFGGWQPQERLSRADALAGYTTGAAYGIFAEKKIGRIAVGYRADFLFLDRDPMLATPQDLRETRVLETWIGGVRAWKAGDPKPDNLGQKAIDSFGR
jgi:hypothetical protein